MMYTRRHNRALKFPTALFSAVLLACSLLGTYAVHASSANGRAVVAIEMEIIEVAAGKVTLREGLQPDSIEFIVEDLAVGSGGKWSKLNFSIENLSGIGLGIALYENGTSAGPCAGEHDATGFNILNDYKLKDISSSQTTWIPNGAMVSATIRIHPNDCSFESFSGMATVPVTVTLVVASGKDFVVMPVTNTNVRVRQLR